MSTINTVLTLGFLALISAYILYFGTIAGLPPIILVESIIIAFMVGVIIKQRTGIITSSIAYIASLTMVIVTGTTITEILAIHVYAGILLAVNIVLALLALGSIKR